MDSTGIAGGSAAGVSTCFQSGSVSWQKRHVFSSLCSRFRGSPAREAWRDTVCGWEFRTCRSEASRLLCKSGRDVKPCAVTSQVPHDIA